MWSQNVRRLDDSLLKLRRQAGRLAAARGWAGKDSEERLRASTAFTCVGSCSDGGLSGRMLLPVPLALAGPASHGAGDLNRECVSALSKRIVHRRVRVGLSVQVY